MGNIKHKCIGKFIIRSKTVKGEPAKTVVRVYDTGIVYSTKFVLSKSADHPGHTNLGTKGGYSLLVNDHAIKFSTLNTIRNVAAQILIDNKVDLKNIL